MSLILFDGPERATLLPLTYLRPVSHCMVGMQPIKDQWEQILNEPSSDLTDEYLKGLYPYHSEGETLFVNGSYLPLPKLVELVKSLSLESVLLNGSSIVAFKTQAQNVQSLADITSVVSDMTPLQVDTAEQIKYPEDIISKGQKMFELDFQRLVKTSESSNVDSSVRLRGDQIFIGKNVRLQDCIINAQDGPVYIDDDVEIMENAVVKGPAYIGKGTKIHVSAKVYAMTMLGPECRIGGEIKRTTIFGYSNKAHDGYLGDSVISKWCNLGADTNNSNMKNTYGKVSIWDFTNKTFRKTDRQFLGMILGDHTMAAINTSFNTGTSTGIFVNILNRTPERFINSFSWGANDKYKLEKAIEVANIVMKRRTLELSSGYRSALTHLYNL